MAIALWPKLVLAALILAWSPVLSREAFAAAVLSDTLQVGTSEIQSLAEGTPEGSISSMQSILGFGQGTHVIALTEPGTGLISDLVRADLTPVGCLFTCVTNLTVTLTSDDEAALTTTLPIDAMATETGVLQDLGPAFTSLFGLNFPLPAINVMSDVDVSVPEPASLAVFGTTLVGFGVIRRRLPVRSRG